MSSTIKSDEQQISDEALMLAYADGDASAFDQLYHRNKIAVYRFYIRQNISSAVAEDFCHDTWLKVINARKSYQVSALFRTYLFTIARRVLIDYQQKKSTHNECSSNDENNVLFVDDQIGDDDNDNYQINSGSVSYYQNSALKEALHKQINELPFEQKQVFILKQESGFSIEQVADITKQNKEKVKSRWRYALSKLREGLTDYVK